MESGRGRLILVTGGARSGKSSFAEKYAVKSAKKKVIYLATAAAEDDEMSRRIKKHQQRRPQHFITAEERYYPHRILQKEDGEDTFFLLDCLTLLLSNHLLSEENTPEEPALSLTAKEEEQGEKILQYIADLAVLMHNSLSEVLVVTNEVGMGVVPEIPIGRLFRDLSGRANQIVAEQADEVWMMVCGIARRIK